MKVAYFIFLMIFSLNSFSQTLSDEEKFIAICKAIASIEDVRDSIFLCDYKGKNTIFIMSKNEFVHDPNKRIDIDIDSIRLSIWFWKELFFRNIPYWFVFNEVSEKGRNKVVVKLRSYNSVNVKDKKPILYGEVILRFQNEEYHIVKKRLNISEIQ